jgi:hypothetical protein
MPSRTSDERNVAPGEHEPSGSANEDADPPQRAWIPRRHATRVRVNRCQRVALLASDLVEVPGDVDRVLPWVDRERRYVVTAHVRFPTSHRAGAWIQPGEQVTRLSAERREAAGDVDD